MQEYYAVYAFGIFLLPSLETGISLMGNWFGQYLVFQ